MLFTTNDRGFLQILPSTHPMKSVSNQPVEIATGNGDCCCPFCFPEAMPCSSGGKAAAPAADGMVRAVSVGSAEQQQQESPEGAETTGGDLEYPKSGQLAGYHLCLNRFVEVSCLPVFKPGIISFVSRQITLTISIRYPIQYTIKYLMKYHPDEVNINNF